MSEPENAPTSESASLPPEVTASTAQPTSLAPEPTNPAAADDLPEWEPLTPELVEDEAIRGDFMLRWAVVLLALLIGCRQIVETSTLVHVKTGQYLASHGFWPPTNDVFSSTAGKHRWVNLSWMWDLISSGLFAIGEGVGLSLGTALLVALTWWLLGQSTRAGVSSWFGSILGALTLLACHRQFSGQPETVTLLGLAATLWWLHVWRSSIDAAATSSPLALSRRPVSLWWLVPGFALWSNLDNRMFLGLTLLVLWGIGDLIGHALERTSLAASQRNHFWKILGTCIVASCFNPFGARSLFSLLTLFGTEYPAWRHYVSANSGQGEVGAFSLLTSGLWQSGQDRLPLAAGVAVLMAALVSIVLNARRANLGDALAFAGFVLLAGIASHELPAASVVACVLGTLSAQQWYQSSFRQAYSIEPKELLFTRGGRAVTVLAFFALAVMSVNQSLFGLDGKRVGIGMSDRLRSMIEAYREATANAFDDRPFNFVPNQGDVLLWLDQKPFLDSRLAVFAGRGESDLLLLHDQTRRSLAGLDDPTATANSIPPEANSAHLPMDWQSVFEHFQMTHALPRLFGGNPTAYFRMLASSDWRMTHMGAHCAVFYRRDDPAPELRKFVEQHQLSLTKLAFQADESPSLRTDWPHVRTSFQKFLSPPHAHRSNKVLEAENLMMHLRAVLSGNLSIEQPTAVAMAHLAIRKANAGLAESVDQAEAFQIQGEAYAFLLGVENSIVQSAGAHFDNQLRFYQSLAAFHQAILLEPKSLVLRNHLINLLLRHNRIDLVLRELDVIDELAPPTNIGSEGEDELLQRRVALRDECENRRTQLQESLSSLRDQGQEAAALAPQVFASGFVLEALRLLESDRTSVDQSPDLQLLHRLLQFEAGDIETVYGQFEYESEANRAAWRIPAAWARLAHGEHGKAIELWKNHTALTQESSLTTVLSTLPMIQSPFHMLGFPNVWPTQHRLLFTETQSRLANESAVLLWYTAMCQLESGKPQLAGKTIAGLLELNPDTSLRPLIRFYRFVIDDELIDNEPPSQWIPIDGDTFMPDESADTETK